MRIKQIALNVTAANQFSPWLEHDRYQASFNVGLAVYFGSGLSATLKVQLLMDDPWMERQVSISQSVQTVTIVDPGPQIQGVQAAGHGLAVGDYVYLTGIQYGIAGEYSVATVTSSTVYTITVTPNQTLAQQPALIRSGRIIDHATMTGLTARAGGNQAFPVWGSRLFSTAFVAGGYAFLVATQGGTAS